LVEIAYDLACKKDYFKAINLNGLIYSSTLGFNNSIAIDALQSGALASGLSGTGSAFFAIVDEDSINQVHESWMKYEGQVIETKIDNKGCCLL
jgi:shikimate kinase